MGRTFTLTLNIDRLLAVCLVLTVGAVLRYYSVPQPPKPVPPAAERAYVTSVPVPDTILFAGERVPVADPLVRERLEQELVTTAYAHASTLLVLKRAARWRRFIEPILNEQGVPTDFFYLMIAESHLKNLTSVAKAQGFWQFLVGTAREYGLEVNAYVDERDDPLMSTRAAARYLKDAHGLFHNWGLVAASYNRGMGGIQDDMGYQYVNSYYDLWLNPETSRYLYKIIAWKLIAERPEAYGYKVGEEDGYRALPARRLEARQVPDLAEWARRQGTNLNRLRSLNPWIRQNSLPPRRTPYILHVPATESWDTFVPPVIQ